MTTTTHHSRDCDGYVYAHLATVKQVSREGRGMWQAVCDACDWQGSRVGPDARDLPTLEASHHTVERACNGECNRDPL